MNQFIFCCVVDTKVCYGFLKAVDGQDARRVLESQFKGREIQSIEFKGLMNSSFHCESMENQSVLRGC